MNRNFLLTAITLVLTLGLLSCNSEKKKTQVLVIGTIHGGHDNNPNYTDQDLVNILGTYNPDAICVEIPPSYFRQRSYLKEMMIASIYGFDNSKKVYPIDWWTNTNDQAERDKYIQTDDYKIKSQKQDSLEKSNAVMQNFIKKYGTLSKIWNENKMGYDFYNGKEYNDYVREWYTILINIYGDGCMNLSSEKRNAKMFEMIDSAIIENQGKRIIVLTGAEHKYYFDDAVSKRKDLKLVDFKEILPLKETPFTQNISEFVERNLAKGYYDVSDSSTTDIIYRGALVPILHGPYMDYNPDTTIPPENLMEAQLIVAEWEEHNPQSVALHFEKSWLKFLQKDYQESIKLAESISERLNEFPKDMRWFFIPHYWRNLGFCYDMTGQREKAVNAYQNCKISCEETGVNKDFAKNYIYQNFENEPYTRVKI